MIEKRQPRPVKNMVESTPVKKGGKLSQITALNSYASWEDVRGLSWLFNDDWS